jgi:hypothetical protein
VGKVEAVSLPSAGRAPELVAPILCRAPAYGGQPGDRNPRGGIRVRYLTDDEEARLRAEIGVTQWPVVALALDVGRDGARLATLLQECEFRLTLETAFRYESARGRGIVPS